LKALSPFWVDWCCVWLRNVSGRERGLGDFDVSHVKLLKNLFQVIDLIYFNMVCSFVNLHSKEFLDVAGVATFPVLQTSTFFLIYEFLIVT